MASQGRTWSEVARRLPLRSTLARLGEYRLLALGLALLCASVWGFGVLVEDVVTGDPIVRTDERLATWLHEHARDGVTDFFRVLTKAGNGVFLVGVCALATVVLLRRGLRSDVALLWLALGGAEVLTYALKAGFRRERPFFTDPLTTATYYSFPSGHATVSMAVYGALAFVIARRSGSRVVAVATLILAAIVVAAIGFSRLYLGVHYLSDVLAGFAVGLAWLVLCIFAVALHESRSSFGSRRFRPRGTGPG